MGIMGTDPGAYAHLGPKQLEMSSYLRNKDLSPRTRKSVLELPSSSPSSGSKSFRHDRLSSCMRRHWQRTRNSGLVWWIASRIWPNSACNWTKSHRSRTEYLRGPVYQKKWKSRYWRRGCLTWKKRLRVTGNLEPIPGSIGHKSGYTLDRVLTELKSDNQRLKDENGALIRVISKLSK
ncbi:uncharacterized protein LOC108276302 isoform X5 [Ictalurus punctatus]|uniref:Uncharacterized protein LOC108276302 isoform X5 n=1 Tax=Ictalurus punctatus TaxID=7998 RepID=A0A979F7W4_ICTPU|nr:uncharacterized protein LOC108276302 isoform X5 [Ictalurus punctatus]